MFFLLFFFVVYYHFFMQICIKKTPSPQITTMVSTFAAFTHREEFTSPEVTRQLSEVGVLFGVEGLLSCHGSEMGMLEDTITAVEDLRYVSLRLVEASTGELRPVPHLRE